MKIVPMLKEGARGLGVELDDEMVELFGVYLAELKKWNQKINLTSITEDEKIVSYHFLDSISCIKSGRIGSAALVADIGTGAGFPGVPLKIVKPSIALTLIESSKKKSDFLKFLMKELQLKNTEVVWSRVEAFAGDPSNRERYDIVVARAVSPLPVLVEYGMPLTKVGGVLIAQKGREDQIELEQGEKAAAILGGNVEEILGIDVPFLHGNRHLIIVRKEASTPSGYPRKAGIAAKRPLGKH